MGAAKKLRLMTIVGTRPEVIKMSEIIKKCDKYFEHILVHTGQNYDYTLNEVFFKELGLRAPDYYLGVVGDNIGQTMGNVIAKSYELMIEVKPDAIIVLGDTNSCLSVLSAKRLKIPVFHMEAGNRCKDENLPEEVIRRIVDVTSDVNLCYSENARKYILDSGVKPEYTYVVGSPMAEVLDKNIESINSSNILDELELESGKYILLSAHREENIDIENNFFSLMNAINAIAETYNMPILYSCHPRSKKNIELRGFKFDDRVIQHQPLGFFDYNKLQQNAFCVVSDSGTVPEESAYFKFPAVSIRTSIERPEAMEGGVFTVGAITSEQVLQAVNLAVSMHANGDDASVVPAYKENNVSTKIVKIIQSYVGIVNKMIWRKTYKRKEWNMRVEGYVEYFIGKRFDDGKLFEFSGGGQTSPSRIIKLAELVTDKKIIHLGATDHLELIDEKIEKNIWLHKRLTEVANKCIGVDINRQAVEYCNQKGWNNIYNIDMILQSEDMDKLINDETYDYIVAGEIIEHINNPVEFLSKIKSNYEGKCKKIIITVPNAFRSANIKFALRGIEGINTDHRYWFTPYTICKVVAESGMVPEEILYAGKEYGKTGVLLGLFKNNICAEDIMCIASI